MSRSNSIIRIYRRQQFLSFLFVVAVSLRYVPFTQSFGTLGISTINVPSSSVHSSDGYGYYHVDRQQIRQQPRRLLSPYNVAAKWSSSLQASPFNLATTAATASTTTTSGLISTLIQLLLQHQVPLKFDWGYVYMSLLAIQFAIHPILIKKFVPKENKIIKSTYLFVECLTQLILASLFLILSSSSFSVVGGGGNIIMTNRSRIIHTIVQSFYIAGIPAGLSVVQNFYKLIGYQNLQPITFNAINQTKTLFAALFCYILLHQKQSLMQMMALGILILSALFMEDIIPITIPHCINNNNNTFFRKLFPRQHRQKQHHQHHPEDKEVNVSKFLNETLSSSSCPSSCVSSSQPSVSLSSSSKSSKETRSFSSSTSIAAAQSSTFLSDGAETTTTNNRNDEIMNQIWNYMKNQTKTIISSSRIVKSVSPSRLVGIISVLVASVISGLGGALTQRSLQSSSLKLNSLMFSIQLSWFSMMYILINVFIVNVSKYKERDRIFKEGIFIGWTPYTLIPAISTALGGILVGMVTKYCGVIKKGFSLIIGLFLSGVFQNILAYRQQLQQSTNTAYDTDANTAMLPIKAVTAQQWVGGVLAAISIWMHSAFS